MGAVQSLQGNKHRASVCPRCIHVQFDSGDDNGGDNDGDDDARPRLPALIARPRSAFTVTLTVISSECPPPCASSLLNAAAVAPSALSHSLTLSLASPLSLSSPLSWLPLLSLHSTSYNNSPFPRWSVNSNGRLAATRSPAERGERISSRRSRTRRERVTGSYSRED
ncbi:unnamed protein product [Lampetra planeri]